jgi:biopolymer transport protein ExbD
MARRKNRTLEMLTKEKFELQMTPMIDVTFLLLIFFMCTIKFKVLEGKLSAYLPKDVGVNVNPAEPREKIDIEIRVINEGQKLDAKDRTKAWSGTGRFVLSPDRQVRYRVVADEFSSIDQVRRRLVELRAAFDEDRPVTLDPKQGVVNREVLEVVDAALAANFLEVTFRGAGGGVGK